MIKAEKGHVEISGDGHVVMSELTMMLRGVRASFSNEIGEEKADERIDECVRLSRSSKQDIHKEAVEAIKNLINDLFNSLPDSDEE